MARVDVRQDVVLERFVARLRDQLGLNARQCYETLDAMSPRITPVGGGYVVTVAPGDGVFVEGEQAPGNSTEEWTILVTIYSRTNLDDAAHDERLLREPSRGLLNLKRLVLKALVGHDTQTVAVTAGEEDDFLRQLTFAIHAQRPQFDDEKKVGWMTLEFGIHFDWEIEN